MELQEHQARRARYWHRQIAEGQVLGRLDDLSLPGIATHDDVDDLVAFAETHATRKRIVGITFQDTEQEPALLEGRPSLSPQHPRGDAQEGANRAVNSNARQKIAG